MKLGIIWRANNFQNLFMTPDNKALQRTYLIGGPPRIGKTTLAYKLAEKVNGHVVMTDAIRNSAKKVCEDKSGPLFMINHYNELSELEWLGRYAHNPDRVVKDQIAESQAIWRSVVSFCNMFCEDNVSHIIEGVAVMPEFVASMDNQPEHIIFVGNTSDEHVEMVLDYGKKFPEQCWMASLGYSEERIRAFANYVKKLSEYYRSEAKKHGFKYCELSDENFDESLVSAINHVTKG